MRTRIFILMMNKIFTRAHNIMRKHAMNTFGSIDHLVVFVLFHSL